MEWKRVTRGRTLKDAIGEKRIIQLRRSLRRRLIFTNMQNPPSVMNARCLGR